MPNEKNTGATFQDLIDELYMGEEDEEENDEEEGGAE